MLKASVFSETLSSIFVKQVLTNEYLSYCTSAFALIEKCRKRCNAFDYVTIRKNLNYNHNYMHCLKSVRIQSFSGPYFPAFGLNTERATPYFFVFSPNAGKYGPEKLRIRTLFMQ